MHLFSTCAQMGHFYVTVGSLIVYNFQWILGLGDKKSFEELHKNRDSSIPIWFTKYGRIFLPNLIQIQRSVKGNL